MAYEIPKKCPGCGNEIRRYPDRDMVDAACGFHLTGREIFGAMPDGVGHLFIEKALERCTQAAKGNRPHD